MTTQPSLSFHGALAQAYRRACRAGIAEVGTDLVMCYAAARVRESWERTALTALREASLSARRQGHRYTGTTHLLGALLADPDGPASRLLRQLGVDPDAVRTDIM